MILLSVAASGWCIFRLKKGGKRRKLYYAGIVLSLLMIVLCIRGSYHIFQYCDFYNKILRPTSSFYLDELSLSPEECREDFDEITDIVQGNYAPIARHKGIDLKELNKKYKEEMKAVKMQNNMVYSYYDTSATCRICIRLYSHQSTKAECLWAAETIRSGLSTARIRISIYNKKI